MHVHPAIVPPASGSRYQQRKDKQDLPDLDPTYPKIVKLESVTQCG